MKVASLDRQGRSLTEVLELRGWLREKGAEITSLREPIDQGWWIASWRQRTPMRTPVSWSAEIDGLVYDRYGLTDEDVADV